MKSSQLWPDQTPELWSVVAVDVNAFASRFSRPFAEEAIDLVKLQPGEHLVDVAAGTGSLAFAAAERGAQVVATDFAPGMVEQMRARIRADGLSNIQAEVMDGQSLDLPDSSFDVAASQFGLIFFPDMAKGFQELYRVLKPGGRGMVLGWSTIDRNEAMAPFLEAVQTAGAGPPPWPGPPPALRLSDPEVFAGEMKDAGFQHVEISKMTHPLVSESPTALWKELASVNPMIQAMSQALGAEAVESIGRTYVQMIRDRYGDGPLSLDAEALVGIGVK